MQKVVTLNTCCDIACLTLQLPHITTGSFQSHQCQQTSSHMKKICISQVSVVTFLGAVGKWICFFSEITQIFRSMYAQYC